MFESKKCVFFFPKSEFFPGDHVCFILPNWSMTTAFLYMKEKEHTIVWYVQSLVISFEYLSSFAFWRKLQICPVSMQYCYFEENEVIFPGNLSGCTQLPCRT